MGLNTTNFLSSHLQEGNFHGKKSRGVIHNEKGDRKQGKINQRKDKQGRRDGRNQGLTNKSSSLDSCQNLIQH